MSDLNPATLILVIAVAAFTAATAVWDLRWRRIPNWLTLPMFGAGILFQTAVSFLYGWQHLASALQGFVVGFGLLFVLWFVGGGGGGDVKLMGALSVWLGFQLTLYVLIVSTFLVLVGTAFVVAATVLSKGTRRLRHRSLPSPPGETLDSLRGNSAKDQPHRRIMAYATPVAIATWLVVVWKLPTVDQAWQLPDAAAVEQIERESP